MRTRTLTILLCLALLPALCHADATSGVIQFRRVPLESSLASNAVRLPAGSPAVPADQPGHLWLGTLTGNVLVNAQGQTGQQGPQGNPGVMGTPGTVWYNSAGAPSAGTGINGDYDLDTASGNVYTKAAGAWTLIENIKGANGATGSPGAAGVPGQAATIAVGTVTQGSVGSQPIVTNTGTSNAAVFAFTLPAPGVGATGATGSQGAIGPNYPIKSGSTTLTSAPTSLSFGSGLSATATGNDVLVTNNYTYTLPAASSTALGGVSVPASGGLTVSGGALSEAVPITSIGAGLGLTGGTLIDTLAASSQAANTVYAGPASGASGAMGVRGLVSADLPVPLTLTATGPGVTPLTIVAASGQSAANFKVLSSTGQLEFNVGETYAGVYAPFGINAAGISLVNGQVNVGDGAFSNSWGVNYNSVGTKQPFRVQNASLVVGNTTQYPTNTDYGAGSVFVGGSVTAASYTAGTTPGYTGTIPATATGYKVVGGITVGYFTGGTTSAPAAPYVGN